MAIADQHQNGTIHARYCPQCGHLAGEEHFCTECGTALESTAEMSATEVRWPPSSTSPDSGSIPPGSAASILPASAPPRSRVVLTVGAALGVVVVVAAAAIILLSGSSSNTGSSNTGSSSAYRQKLQSALAPLVAANRTLSTALQSLDGSQSTIAAARNAAAQTQSAVVAARGAVAVLTVPSSDSTLSQQVQQALTDENGYVQAVASTLSDPVGGSASQLQTLATGAQSALVPLSGVAAAAGSSLSGADNLSSWAAGAAGLTQRQKDAAQQAAIRQAAARAAAGALPRPLPYMPYVPPPGGLTQQYGNISATQGVSSALANNVFYQYWTAIQNSSDTSALSAWSSATDAWYGADCTSTGSTVSCSISGTADPNAEVVFPQSAVDNYTQAEANTYAASPNAAP